MAQRAAISADHSFYTHSSPLLCLGDTIVRLLRIGITSIKLGLSPKNATLVEHQIRILISKKEEEKNTPDSKMWPRWLFFAMTTLPAAVKLCSFDGMPWTMALGMVTLSSFLVNEVIVLIARTDDKSPRIFHYARTQHENFRDTFRLVEKTGNLLAWTLHCAFLLWAAVGVYNHLYEYTTTSETFEDVTRKYFTPVMVLSFIVMVATWFKFPRVKEAGSLEAVAFSTSNVGIYISGFFFTLVKSSSSRLANVSLAFGLLPQFHRWSQDGMKILCMKYQRLGRALYMVKDSTVKEGGEQDDDEGPRDQGEYDESAFFSLWIFVFNMVICVLWYAFIFDPAGTVKPEWTEALG